MIAWILQQWEKNKNHLREYLKCHNQNDYSYEKLVEILIRECINFGAQGYDLLSEEFTCLDHGEYQGTQIYILHRDTYQPSIEDYYVFDNYYGSCSYCDTLLGIQYLDDSEYPTEEQLDEYMILYLHMIQRIKCLGYLYD